MQKIQKQGEIVKRSEIKLSQIECLSMLKLFDKTHLQMCILKHRTYSLTKQLGNTFPVCLHDEFNNN